MKCPIHGDNCPGDSGDMFMDMNHPDDMYGVWEMREKKMTEDKIYFIPQHLHCPKCNLNLGSPLKMINAYIVCPQCQVYWFPKAFGKQFAVVTGLKK